MPYDKKLAARIRTVLASRSDVVEKHMFGGVAFMVRGHMSCGIVGSSLMVRLSPADAGVFLQEPHVRPMDFTGRPMRGFLFVDSPGIATAASLRKWIGRVTAHAEAQPKKRKQARAHTLGASTTGREAQPNKHLQRAAEARRAKPRSASRRPRRR